MTNRPDFLLARPDLLSVFASAEVKLDMVRTAVCRLFDAAATSVTHIGCAAQRPRPVLFRPRPAGSSHRLVMTTSRYSPGTTMVSSPEVLKRPIRSVISRASALPPASSSASNALSIGP